jgi:transposase
MFMVETNEIAELKAFIISLQAEIEQLRAENLDLKARLTLNSTNSSKPPASDGLAKKPLSWAALIKPAIAKEPGKKTGGQPGHPGKTLQFVEQPDTICLHTPSHCQQCGLELTDTPTMSERRQVFDLPQPRLYVQEHRVFQRQCSCGCVQQGIFPAHVVAPVQYGPGIHAQSILLNIDYKVPFAKIRQFWADVVGHAYNPATLSRIEEALSAQLVPIETQIKARLQAAHVCHFDETGLRVGGKLHWLHVACTALYTYLFVHPSRGQKALKSTQSVFEGCTNWLVHDCWSSYFAAGAGRHALCGAHLLRELQGQIEADCLWAKHLHAYLLELYKATRHGPLAANEGRSWQQVYRQLCEQGLEEEPGPIVFYNKEGEIIAKRPKQSKAGRPVPAQLATPISES